MSLRTRNRRNKRHDLRRIVLASIGGMVGAGTLVAAHSFELVRDELRANKCDAIKLGQNTKIFDRRQKELSTIAAENNRLAIPFEQMPKHLIDATVAIEDKKFFSHNGVDYDRIVGAAVKDIGRADGEGRQGGSTLTMQLMKNLCHPKEPRTVSIKLTEAYLAKAFEERYSKQEIVKRYLNSVFYGNNSIGVQAASLTYFSRDTKQLTLAQAALLAGLPQAPSDYNPFRHPEEATRRRNLVLDEMLEDGYITADRAAKAKAAGLQLKRGNAFGLKREGYFVDYIESILTQALGRKKTREGGYRVYTTINPKLQQAARNAMANVLTRYSSSDSPSAAVVMIEAKTGRILTMASSEEYNRKNQFNVAGPDAKRRAGSTFKTFVLTEALRQGVSPNTRYFSKSPIESDGSECSPPVAFKVETFGRKGGGMMSLSQATVRSDNSVYAQMTCDLGPPNVFKMARTMGVTSLDPAIDQYTISLGLGGLHRGVSVLDMARAYAPLANGGYKVKLLPMTKLVRPDGKVTQFKPQLTRILSDGVTSEVTKILRSNVQGGTGTTANLPNVPVAGKTGTVDDFTDAWFVGYTPKYVTAVWVGYPDRDRSMPGVTGGSLPASIWRQFMEVATKGESGQAFPEPKTQFVSKPFSGYWTRQAAELAAAAAKKKAEEEEAKRKAEEEAGKDDEPDDEEPTLPGGPTPGPPPAPAPTPAPTPPTVPPPTP